MVLDFVSTGSLLLSCAKCLFLASVWQQQVGRKKLSYFRLQYRYMDTIMAASWWGGTGRHERT